MNISDLQNSDSLPCQIGIVYVISHVPSPSLTTAFPLLCHSLHLLSWICWRKKSNREGVYVWGCVDQHYIVLNNFLHCFWLFIDSGFEACTAELGAGKVHLVQLCHQIAFCFCKLVSGNRDTALSTDYW